MKNVKSLTSAALLLAMAAACPVQAEEPMVEYRLESAAARKSYANIENGPLVASPIGDGAWSSIWYVTKVDGIYEEIRNRWTGCYLHVEFGKLECSERKPGWHSAQWRIDTLQAAQFISNRWTSCKIGNEGGKLNCSKSLSENQKWFMQPVNAVSVIRKRPKPGQTAAAPPPPAPAAPPPEDISIYAWFGSTDGNYPDTFAISHKSKYYEMRDLSQKRYTGGEDDIMNDDIETVIVGKNTRVVLYEDANFQGRSLTLTCGEYELIGDPENEVSSIKIFYDPNPNVSCSGLSVEIRNWN
jgi:hypothetical protein